MVDNHRTRLGKGLGALLGDYMDEPAPDAGSVRQIPLKRLRPNPFQPRSAFQSESLEELQQSIKHNGLLQPLVVRAAGDEWEIVAGERRFRALQRLRWEAAPAVVREFSDEQMLLSALVENLQRESLGALDEAMAYQTLVETFGFSQQQVAERVGKSRPAVANSLRLLGLPEAIRKLLAAEKITAGHARAILSVEARKDQLELARKIVAKRLSVRQAENQARNFGAGAGKKRPRSPVKQDPVARRAETLLARELGTRVAVRLSTATSGEIRLAFHDSSDFERLVTKLVPQARTDLFT
ncbi:MAG: ParB/RepB/Spo0J family partition protein [Gemmatimonadota bacterium]